MWARMSPALWRQCVTVSVAVFVTPVAVPEITTEVVLWTLLVVTVKLADAAPAGTVTLAGTLATVVLPLERVTTTPPAGAAAPSVAVPVLGWPPWMLDAGAAVLDVQSRLKLTQDPND